jgi:hypothetical protein
MKIVSLVKKEIKKNKVLGYRMGEFIRKQYEDDKIKKPEDIGMILRLKWKLQNKNVIEKIL